MNTRPFRFLTLRDIGGRSKSELYPLVARQFNLQLSHLQSLRFRRRDILSAFELSCSLQRKGVALHDWVNYSRKELNKAYDMFVLDGTKWQGKELGNNLSVHVNMVCSHCIHALFLLQLLDDDIDEPQMLSLRPFCDDIGENVRALAREKYGASPDVVISGQLDILAIPSVTNYIIAEILKNSIEAVITKHGPLSVEDVDPVMISLQSLGPKAGSLTISDKGVGMSDQQLERCRDAFFTTTVPREEPNYHYSREFGTVFSGAGFGLLKSKVFMLCYPCRYRN